MLIIFDLDDTLIDTSGCVTPFKMKLCVEELIALGVKVPPFANAYEELLELNTTVAKSPQAIELFAKKYHATDAQIKKSLDLLTTELPSDFRVEMTPYAKEVISFYHSICPIAIVTGGHPPFQWDKLKKAGIEVSFFSMIGIPEDSVKKPYYSALQEKFQLPSQKIWVCGDRVEMDLRPAFELGFQTVHMQWGRGARVKQEPWITHSIRNLNELKGKIP